MKPTATLIVGVGSPHGDDRAGWEMLRHLQPLGFPPQCRIRAASSPLEILDWIDGIQRLILCDACRDGGPPGQIRRFVWPARRLLQTSWSGSHDFSLVATLELAQRLQRLPPAVTLYGVVAQDAAPLAPLSAAVRQALPRLAQRIAAEMGAADVFEELGEEIESCTNSR